MQYDGDVPCIKHADVGCRNIAHFEAPVHITAAKAKHCSAAAQGNRHTHKRRWPLQVSMLHTLAPRLLCVSVTSIAGAVAPRCATQCRRWQVLAVSSPVTSCALSHRTGIDVWSKLTSVNTHSMWSVQCSTVPYSTVQLWGTSLTSHLGVEVGLHNTMLRC